MKTDVKLLRPDSLDEALKMLHDQQEHAMLLAGGTDVIPGLRHESRRFQHVNALIDIQHLAELQQIGVDGDVLMIGGGVTFSQAIRNDLVQQYAPLLVKAAGSLGSVQIRNRATIAGNFINNAPCADSVPPLLVMDADIVLRSVSNERTVSLADLLEKPYRTEIAPDEIVTRIKLPVLPIGYRGDFYKLGRRRGVAISRISLAVLVKMNGIVLNDIRIASGAVTPIGKRFIKLEASAKNQQISPESLRYLSRQLGRQILQTTGVRWSTPYKLPVVQQMCFQLLSNLLAVEGA